MLLVTGITGLTGRFLFNEFCKAGQVKNLRCLIRPSSDISWMQNSRPDFAYGDVSSVDDLMKSMRDVSTVIHLVNIRYSPQIIKACHKAKIRRVIFVNTTGIYSKYQAYSALYRELEAEILSSELDYTIIRPTMIYGNEQDKNIHKLVKLLNRLPVFPVIGNGRALMQPIYAGDLAKAVFAASQTQTAIKQDYNVAGKEPICYLDLLTEIASALSKKPIFIYIPYFVALLAGKIGDMFPNGLVNFEKVQRLSEDKVFDYIKAQQELNFQPMSFQDGIKHEVQCLMDAGFI